MTNLDDWKLEPQEDELENECLYCGEQCEKAFCNKQCEKAYFNDQIWDVYHFGN